MCPALLLKHLIYSSCSDLVRASLITLGSA